MCVCVCLCLSTASALTGIGGSRLRRPAKQSHSEPSQLSIKQPTLGQNYDSIRNNSLYPSVSHAPTHAKAGEVKVTAQPCLNRLPTCKATLVCQECLAVLSVSLSLLWQADKKCHDSQEKTLQTCVCVCVRALRLSLAELMRGSIPLLYAEDPMHNVFFCCHVKVMQ